MPFCDTATGASLFYEDVGEGVPLIALHGWMGTGAYDFGAMYDWLNALGLRVIAPTRRGYGESLPKPRDYPYDFYQRDARDILALMDALAIEKAHLLGYSDGGETALCVAGLAPERCLSVTVWGAVGAFEPSLREHIGKNYPADWVSDELLALNGWDRAAANQVVLGWIAAVRFMIDRGGDVSLSLADRITCPLLLMLGNEDRLNPEAYGQQYVERAPNGQLIMFQCGHAIHTEQPELFQRVVSAFLSQQASSKIKGESSK